MKTQHITAALEALLASAVLAAAQGTTAFTYQGRLDSGGGAATGLYEMSFTLYDSTTNGNVVAVPVTVAPLSVSNGLFTATLDFGANAFTGANRWLEISVTVFGSDQPVVTLVPRQPITATPYALHAVNAAGLISFNNAPLDIKVNGQRALRIEVNHDGVVNFIAGAESNHASEGVQGATIGGGGARSYEGLHYTNEVWGDFGTIGGGADNRTVGRWATASGGLQNVSEGHWTTIGGGWQNVAPGDWAVIAGGYGNTNSGEAGFVGGGRYNTVTGGGATVGGGYGNQSTSDFAVVPGGQFNAASGISSFAAGQYASAQHDGAFVWADYSERQFASAAANEFAVRASGGVRFVSAIEVDGTPTAGVTLAAGSGTWSSLSDRNAKENFAPTDAREILDKVAGLPLASWNYKAQGAGVRHLGPTAQDFRAAFHLGESERTIATVDADGVALAAIQGLNEKVEAGSERAEVRTRQLGQRLEQTATEITELKQRLAALERIVLNLSTKGN